MTIILVLFIAVFVVMILPQFIPIRLQYSPRPAEPPVTQHVKLYSGPNDGEVHEIPGKKEELPHFFVAPYLPTDENGMPVPDEDHIVHSGNGMMYVKPHLAYYQQVTDEDYIYVRDISEHELKKINLGQLPEFEKHNQD